MHDGDVKLAGASVDPNGHLKVDRLALEALVIDPFDMPKEVDLNFLPLYVRSYYSGLRGVIICVGNQQFPIQSICELLSGLPVPEVVDVFGGVGAVSGELLDVAVALGPQIEGLTTYDEGFVT